MICYKIIKNLFNVIFISFLLLYPAFAEKPKNIILEANGQGNTENQAISNALDILSQQIYVSVDNETKSSETLIGDSFSTNFENNSILSSNGYFQNISIYNKKNSKKIGFEVTVGLTAESISSTIDYLFLQLKYDEIYNLSKGNLKEQLKMANFLFSLTSYAKLNNLTYSKQSINLNEYISQLNKVISADSVTKFVINPEHIDATISIEKIKYKPYTNIYLPRGKYFYEVKAVGYKTVQDSIDLSKGDDIEIEVYLQKQLKSLVPVKIKVINETKINNNLMFQNFQKLISKNQMRESSNSKNYIELRLSEKNLTSVISGYTNHSVDVFIQSYINGVEKSEIFSINNLSKDNKQEVFQNNIINQINKKSEMFFARLFD